MKKIHVIIWMLCAIMLISGCRKQITEELMQETTNTTEYSEVMVLNTDDVNWDEEQTETDVTEESVVESEIELDTNLGINEENEVVSNDAVLGIEEDPNFGNPSEIEWE